MKPNIFFLIIDSFRADRCYNKNKSFETPNLDFLIKNGTYFNQTISCADGTGVSLCSIFTGIFPNKTGLRGKSRFLNGKIPDFFSQMKDEGYTIYTTVPDLIPFRGKLIDYSKENYFTFPIEPPKSSIHFGVGEKILSTLDSPMKEPWIYLIHLMDMHRESIVPEEFKDGKFGETDYEKMISVIDFWLGKIIKKINLTNTIFVVTSDHGEFIRNIDEKKIELEKNKRIDGSNELVTKIAKSAKKGTPSFLKKIGKKSLLSLSKEIQTSKIKLQTKSFTFTPYQKRILFEKRMQPETYLYEDLIHVPLIFAGKNIPKNKIINQLVGSVDIFPTLFDLINIQPKNKIIDGQSLFPYFENSSTPERPIYLESGAIVERNSDYIIGLRTPKYKFFTSSRNSKDKIRLFDLKNDPLEENNVATKNPKLIQEMNSIINQLQEESLPSQDIILSGEEEKKVEDELKKLGYL